MGEARPRPLVAGNWKMNGLKASHRLVEEIRSGYSDALRSAADLLVCPPATLVHSVADLLADTAIAVGGQDSHAEAFGAFTGNVSAEMLADLGARYVILGHSERRAMHREGDAEINAKALAARRAGLVAIVCVGETRAEREAGRATAIVADQLRGSIPIGANGADTIVAYEPVWAIGTGLTPTTADVADMHAMIRGELGTLMGKAEAARTRVLYGGSVRPSNARDLMAVANVNGALVGGASLAAKDFLGIAEAYLPAS